MKIKVLKIHTSNLAAQIDFYAETIGMTLIEKSTTQAKFKLGKSVFVLAETAMFKPYHFAINIPSNKAYEALAWLKKRVDILKDDTIEIHDFKHWNAEAIYFYDADKNIVEFIARKNLPYQSYEKFSTQSLVEISEIGMPVNDIALAYETLQKNLNIPKYDGGFERFCAIGDEYGLFICINKNVKKWFPTGDKAHDSGFEVVVKEGGDLHKLVFADGHIRKVTNS